MRNVDRKERKFLLDAASALQLESQLGAVLKHDAHNRPGGYMVRSL